MFDSRMCLLGVSLLTYLLAKEDLTPEEVNGHAIDVVLGGVDTVSLTAGLSVVFVRLIAGLLLKTFLPNFFQSSCSA